MIRVEKLTRYYGAFPALREVSFEVRAGEVIGLLGLNGAGKSTTLKILAGVLTPSSGRVTMDGLDVTDNADALKARIGFLPEEPPLYRDMTVTEFLLHVAALKGVAAEVARGRLPELVRLVGLDGREHQLITTLSHGYKKRVGIAMAVIHEPSLVILDEPISGLDPKQIKEMRNVIRRIGEGRAVLVSSHILGEIAKTCDRVVVLRDGQAVAVGKPEELVGDRVDERIRVTVAEGSGPGEDLSGFVGRHAAVKAVTPVDTDPGVIAVQVDLDGDARSQLIADVAAAGFAIRLVEAGEFELEDVFLGLTTTGGEA